MSKRPGHLAGEGRQSSLSRCDRSTHPLHLRRRCRSSACDRWGAVALRLARAGWRLLFPGPRPEQLAFNRDPLEAVRSLGIVHLAGVDPTRVRHASTITLKPAPTGDFLDDYPLGGVTYVRLSVSLPPGRQQARGSMIGSGWSSARRSQMRSTRLRGDRFAAPSCSTITAAACWPLGWRPVRCRGRLRGTRLSRRRTGGM